MKKWIQKLKGLFLGAEPGRAVYSIKYVNTLTPEQMRVILNNMVNKFSPNCRPNRITTSVSLVAVEFSQPCMSGEAMKTIAEKTLEQNKPNEVLWVKLDGNQIWPDVK